MNIAIIEDSYADRIELSNDIAEYAKEHSVLVHLTEYQNGESFLEQANISGFDVFFLDIYMDKINGMELAYKIRQTNLSGKIVFITSSADFAIQGYEVNAFYYILKPYTNHDINNVMRLLENSLKQSSRYINIKEGRNWQKILLSNILYADYSNHYIKIHTKHAIISTYMKFAELEELLSQYNEFLSCYRCIIVNMNKIEKIDGVFFLLSNGEYIPINRKRSKEIKAHYANFIFSSMENNGTVNIKEGN